MSKIFENIGKTILDTVVINWEAASNEEIRNNYNQCINKLWDNYRESIAAIHQKKQCISNELAQEISHNREIIKDKHQENTKGIEKYAISLHNLKNYGMLSNPTYSYFIDHGKTPEEIAYSSLKTDGSDLNLTNNGFGNKIAIWKLSSKNDITVYPEFVSNATLECFTLGRPEANIKSSTINDNYELCKHYLQHDFEASLS